ncbi:MAG TPA: hypothetical protein VF412_03725 [Bdellovibrio sp.]|uniref:hypothetical protein n=1 Tax=Bdellovibrio sp. TaxID=28201 RepID=UPI002F1477B5
MKKLILISLIVSSLTGYFAQADELADNSVEESSQTDLPSAKKTHVESRAIGLSSIQWNEPLILKQAGKKETDVANYSGLALSYQKEFTYYHWGWNVGGFLATGRANGGGNSTITYQKDKQSFTMVALTPRAFYRLTGRVNVGVSALIYYRNIDWPTDTAGLTVDATRNFALTALADINVRLSDSFDFYQGLGPLDQGSTFWKIGLAYRF